MGLLVLLQFEISCCLRTSTERSTTQALNIAVEKCSVHRRSILCPLPFLVPLAAASLFTPSLLVLIVEPSNEAHEATPSQTNRMNQPSQAANGWLHCTAPPMLCLLCCSSINNCKAYGHRERKRQEKISLPKSVPYFTLPKSALKAKRSRSAITGSSASLRGHAAPHRARREVVCGSPFLFVRIY